MRLDSAHLGSAYLHPYLVGTIFWFFRERSLERAKAECVSNATAAIIGERQTENGVWADRRAEAVHRWMQVESFNSAWPIDWLLQVLSHEVLSVLCWWEILIWTSTSCCTLVPLSVLKMLFGLYLQLRCSNSSQICLGEITVCSSCTSSAFFIQICFCIVETMLSMSVTTTRSNLDVRNQRQHLQTTLT